MDVLNIDTFFRGSGSLLVSSFVIWCLIKTMPSFHNPFLTPISRITSDNASEKSSILFFRGAFELYAGFFFVGILFAFSGGALSGELESIVAIKQYPAEIRLFWGFLIGCLIAVVIRLSSLYLSISFALHFQIMVISFLGILVFRFIFNYNDLTFISDNLLRNMKDPYRLIPIFVLSIPIIGLIITEGTIYLANFNRKTNLVPLSLVNERIELECHVQQIFNAIEVEKAMRNCINETIRREGLSELCAVVNVIRDETVDMIREATICWLRSNSNGRSDNNIAFKAEQIIQHSCKIIVTNKELYDRINDNQKNYLIRRIKYFPEPAHRRMLLINGKLAIIHLPLPFKKETFEESNCAFIINSFETIYKLREEFYSMWDGSIQTDNFKNFTQLLMEPDDITLIIAKQIYQQRTPTSKKSIIDTLCINEGKVTQYLDRLIHLNIIRKIPTCEGEGFLPRMFVKSCDISDMFAKYSNKCQL